MVVTIFKTLHCPSVVGESYGRIRRWGTLGGAKTGCVDVSEFGYSCLERVVVLVIVPEMVLFSRRAWEVLRNLVKVEVMLLKQCRRVLL